ncbi:stage VI sporulation protein F [Ureibacillus sinduriensis]|uniref:Sporulation protein n=1 Tax=Ureibacillus sinduriensis BLB-1 = JCM 15800 TaxID=1384057 RepID=A0A0A3HMU5_9BACL|nr:stage VI sporulation protein F [Ureibacillus sinduriensis]KGR73704.1 sporulation protein [Ureibacillus sinduriensis BLB-1 = JCM 15800]
MQNPFFKQIENKTGVSMEEIFALANAIQHADFTNEKQVRKIIKRVSKVANKPVTKELEDQIVKSIVQDGKSLDLGKIQKMLG